MNAFYAFGARDAIGFSPFSIENADTAHVALAKSYALLEQLAPVMLANQGGLIVALSRGEYLVAGTGLTITFAPNAPGDPIAGILSAEEGHYEGGRWVVERRLNGDQTHQVRHIRLEPQHFSMQRVRLYRYR